MILKQPQLAQKSQNRQIQWEKKTFVNLNNICDKAS